MSARCRCESLPCPKCGADFDRWRELNIAECNLRQLERFRVALMDIACLSEGDDVDGSFDEPGSAQAAREALSAEWIGPCVHGSDPWDRCDTCVDLGETTAWAAAMNARGGK